jgi:hypothetical protein
MALNLFGPPTKDDIKVAYIDPILGLVEGVSICEANEYAKKEPGTTFIFRNGNQTLQYLNVNEVNQLDPNVLTTTDECGGISQKKECGPPTIQIFGGGGIGAAGNPIVGNDGAILAVDIIRGGNGYQYPPLVSARDICNYGSGATFTTVIGEVVETTETFDNEADFENYELCDPTDVGYGRRYGPDGEDLGPWDPRVYTDPGQDPIRKEIEDFQEIVRKLARTPFWSTRSSRPTRITSSDPKLIPSKYDVTVPAWNEFMNKYAISPTSPSNIRGSDYSGLGFTFEWTEEFPTDGEYIFRGLVDNNALVAELYIDDLFIGNIPRYDDVIRPVQKTITKGVHNVRVELFNPPIISPPNDPEGYIEVDFSVFGQGGENVSGYSFTFTSVDGKDTFTLRGAQISKQIRVEKIKLRPNIDYNVISNHRDSRRLEQGIIKQGTKKREGGLGQSNKIFADGVKTANDNDDIQITSLQGNFTASNNRKIGGRSTYDLTYRVDSSTITTVATSTTPVETASSRSWNQNPMGLALTIDAPNPPPPPQEQPPAQQGRCPNNPIWTTRFPGAAEQWYPVRYLGEEIERTIEIPPATEQQEVETQEVQFSVFGQGGKSVSGYLFTFTAIDGQHTFTLNGAQKSKQTRVEKIQIRKNVNYVIVASHRDGRTVEQGLIKQGTKRREGGIGEGNKIFADGVKTSNDNDDIQVTTNLGKFISSNRTKIGRSTYELTFVLEGSSTSKTPTIPNTPITTTERTSGWSKFLNRYAISPVPPLDTPASDIGGVVFTNSWDIDIPYDGFYKFITEYDDDGKVYLDGDLAFTFQTAQRDIWKGLSDRVKSQKVFITKGRHRIGIELENRKTQTTTQINQKIFRTLDWHAAPSVPEYVEVEFTVFRDGGSKAIVPATFTFTSEDGKESFAIVRPDVNRTTRSDKIKIRPNVNYKVVASGTRTGDSRLEQGLIKFGTKGKETGPGTGNKIFADFIGSTNDNDDLQVTALKGSFTSSNKKQIGGRSTFDLTYRLDPETATSTSGQVTSGTVRDDVTYEGPTISHYQDNRWGPYMNKNSLSPLIPGPTSDAGRKKFIWKKVNFPESGQYDVTFLADSNARLIIGERQVLTAQGFAENPQTFKVNVTQGTYDLVIDSEYPYDGPDTNNSQYFSVENPTGFALEIRKNVSVIQPGSGESWRENPMGIGAILIPPPCPRRIRGRGVVTDVIVNDPGNGYLPPVLPTTTPPSTLALIQTNVPGVPGGGAGAGAGGGTGAPGAPGAAAVPLSIPSPPSGAPTGINARFIPQFEVVRDPVVVDPQKLLQVTDLVGLKQTGYVNGRAYYGAVYYDNGIRYAGFYETVGEPIRVYDTLRESILAQVTTPPSAILRQGTDIRSNNPLLNIPGTVQSTLNSNSIVGAGDISAPSVPFVQEPVQDPIYPVSLRLKRVLVEDPGINYNVTDQIRVIPSNGAVLEPVFGSFGRVIKVAVIDPGFGFTEYPRIEMFTPL